MSRIKDDIEHVFEQASKEVKSWPEWVRSADVRAEFKKLDQQRGGTVMGKRGSSSLRGRDARSGEFIPVAEARHRATTATVERIPKPGQGEASSSPRGRDAGSGQFIPVKVAERRPSTATVERVPKPKR